jgi:hypothetical protein
MPLQTVHRTFAQHWHLDKIVEGTGEEKAALREGCHDMVENIKVFTRTVVGEYCGNDELDAAGEPFLRHLKTCLWWWAKSLLFLYRHARDGNDPDREEWDKLAHEIEELRDLLKTKLGDPPNQLGQTAGDSTEIPTASILELMIQVDYHWRKHHLRNPADDPRTGFGPGKPIPVTVPFPFPTPISYSCSYSYSYFYFYFYFYLVRYDI